jgi:hypothetical protein
MRSWQDEAAARPGGGEIKWRDGEEKRARTRVWSAASAPSRPCARAGMTPRLTQARMAAEYYTRGGCEPTRSGVREAATGWPHAGAAATS